MTGIADVVSNADLGYAGIFILIFIVVMGIMIWYVNKQGLGEKR